MRLILIFAILLPGVATALECQFEKRFSSKYEDINDFTFEDYPALTIQTLEKGYQVTVGGITYGDEYSGTEPTQITKTNKRARIDYETTNREEFWIIRYNKRKKLAVFYAVLDEQKSRLTRVARFQCE